MSPFETDIRGDTATLRLVGEVDVTTAGELRDRVVQLISEGRSNLIFECTSLDFIDSTGLGVLIGARARCLAANGSVALTGVRPALQRLLVVTGIESLFQETTAA